MAEIKQNQIVEEPGISNAPLKGVDVIKGYLKSLPSDPGVYRMINLEGDVLYVGKAKNLKKGYPIMPIRASRASASSG